MANTRRRLLLGLVAAPVSAGAVALTAADPEADQSLIAACERFLVLEDEALAVGGDADQAGINDEQAALVETIIATPATTVAGLNAKARVMQVYATPAPDTEQSTGDRLLQALLRDITGDAGTCTPAATTTAI